MRVNHIKANDCELVGNKLFSLPEKTLIAEIYLKNFDWFEIHYYTNENRESYKWISVIKNVHFKFENSFRTLYNVDGLYVCQNCNRPIMKLKCNNIFLNTIHVRCKCGAIYDNRRLRKQQNDNYSEEV